MNPENTTVFSFLQAAPKGALINGSKNAVEQLDFAQIFTDNWCEHNTSVTVSVKDHEWMDAGAWVFKHFDKVGGVSFLPHSDHVYRQAPYQEITEEEYLVAKESFPVIDWEKFKEFEKEDSTTSAQELACVGVNSCEIL
jgi:ribonucleoside-diphosphate reductase alpha chain